MVDDGIGFPEGRAGRLDSYGILGMRERAAASGGTIELGPRGRGGFLVRVSVPVPAPMAALS